MAASAFCCLYYGFLATFYLATLANLTKNNLSLLTQISNCKGRKPIDVQTVAKSAEERREAVKQMLKIRKDKKMTY